MLIWVLMFVICITAFISTRDLYNRIAVLEYHNEQLSIGYERVCFKLDSVKQITNSIK